MSLHELIYDLYASRQWPAVWLWCGIAGVWAELAWTNTWPFCFQAMTYCVAVIRGPWYGQDFGKLFGNQEAPTFSGVLCGTYEGITKEKFIFSFSMWDSPKNWNFAFFCIKKSFAPRIKCLAQNVALIMLFQYLKRNPAIKFYFSSFSQKTLKVAN